MKRFASTAKAFTLIEVLIVLAILSITFGPVTYTFHRLTLAYRGAIERSDRLTGLEDRMLRICSILASHPDFKISSDNKGASWSGGSLIWKDGAVFLSRGARSARLAGEITHFSLHRRDGYTYLNISCLDKGRRQDLRFLRRVEKRDS